MERIIPESREQPIDSSTVRQEELDKVLAGMLQEIENKRADQLQVMVAETLQSEEKGEGEEKSEK